MVGLHVDQKIIPMLGLDDLQQRGQLLNAASGDGKAEQKFAKHENVKAICSSLD